MITTLKNIVWKNFFLKMTTKKNNGKNSAWSIPTMAKAKAKKLHGPSHCHYAFYAGTAIRQGLLLSWHHQPNHCSFYRPLHHHPHHHYHCIFNPPYLLFRWCQRMLVAMFALWRLFPRNPCFFFFKWRVGSFQVKTKQSFNHFFHPHEIS